MRLGPSFYLLIPAHFFKVTSTLYPYVHSILVISPGWNINNLKGGGVLTSIRLFWFLIIIIFVFAFITYFQPLERIPSKTFSYVWSVIILIKLIDLFFRFFMKRRIEIFKIIDPLLICILIGGIIVSVKWIPVNFSLIRDLVFALSPLFLFLHKEPEIEQKKV